MNSLIAILAAMSITGGILAQTTISSSEVDPHGRLGQAPGCADLLAYVDDLNATLSDHESFVNDVMFASDDAALSLSQDDAQVLLDDGDALLEDLGALEAPGAYDNGQRGLVLFAQTNRDLLYFYVFDTASTVEVYDIDKAIEYIYAGERTAIDQCPDEIDEVGGFILTEPPAEE